MGRVISTDTQKGASTPALTETGQGGLFSTGYLRDDPAGEYVGDGETVVFVVTNADRGVVRERDDERTAITPGDGYRTIGVVTDRRIIVLVGDSDGDERVTLPLVEIDDASAGDGDLVVHMDTGETWRVHAGDGGVADVADFVARAATTWDDLERELDAAKRELVAATAARDDGEYECAIESAQTAYDRLEDAAALVADLAADWPAGAMEERVDHVRDRCVQTVADVRLGHGRAIADDAEERWREEEWEAAFDAYERARAEFEVVESLDATRHDESEALERGFARIEQATEKLAEAPLQRAIDADRRASDADDPATAVADWRTAREWYVLALSLDEDEPERRFAGDTEKVEARLEAVTDRILETAADEGAEALAAGKWYLEADRPGVAREEVQVAVPVFEDALAVARDVRPEEVEELEEWLDDATETLEAATAATDAEDATDAEASESGDDASGDPVADDQSDDSARDEADEDIEDGDPDTDRVTDTEDGDGVESSIEDAIPTIEDASPTIDDGEPAPSDDPVGLEERSAEAQLDAVADADRAAEAAPGTEDGAGSDGSDSDAAEAVVGDGAGRAVAAPGPGAPIPVQLRALDPAGFDALARVLVESMGWTPEDAPAGAPYDFRATREEPDGTVAVRTVHRPTAGPVDADQVEDATDLHDEVPAGGEVMVVTSSGVTEAAVNAARHQSVRLIDEEYITTVLASRETDDLLERIRPRPSD